MTVVRILKVAAGPSYGPYDVGDVVDLNAGDVTKMTGSTGPFATDGPAVVLVPATDPDFTKRTKKGT